jgi:hypothetical protein
MSANAAEQAHSFDGDQRDTPPPRSPSMTLSSLVPHTPFGWAVAGVFAIGMALAAADHWAHLFGSLPYLILLACPLMHVFMHRGHGHAGHDGGKEKPDA